jgi:hypothetical protein
VAFSVGEKNCLTPVTNYATVVDVEAKMDNAKTKTPNHLTPCTCGHVEGEHAHTRPSPDVGPWVARLCYVGGCPCAGFTADVCIECGEVGHFDCGLRDPKVREAAPTYRTLVRLLFSEGV